MSEDNNKLQLELELEQWKAERQEQAQNNKRNKIINIVVSRKKTELRTQLKKLQEERSANLLLLEEKKALLGKAMQGLIKEKATQAQKAIGQGLEEAEKNFVDPTSSFGVSIEYKKANSTDDGFITDASIYIIFPNRHKQLVGVIDTSNLHEEREETSRLFEEKTKIRRETTKIERLIKKVNSDIEDLEEGKEVIEAELDYKNLSEDDQVLIEQITSLVEQNGTKLLQND